MSWQFKHQTQAVGLPTARSIVVRHAGCLSVLGQPAWLTVDGEGQDRVLQPGESLRLQRGHRLVIEPWRAGSESRLLWQPAVAAPRASGRLPLWRAWRGLSAPAA